MSEDLLPLLTIREAATLLHVHVSTMRRWEKAGIVLPIRLGPRGHRRYRQDQISNLLNTPSQLLAATEVGG